MKKIKVKGNVDSGREVFVRHETATPKKWKGFVDQMAMWAMWTKRYARVWWAGWKQHGSFLRRASPFTTWRGRIRTRINLMGNWKGWGKMLRLYFKGKIRTILTLWLRLLIARRIRLMNKHREWGYRRWLFQRVYRGSLRDRDFSFRIYTLSCNGSTSYHDFFQVLTARMHQLGIHRPETKESDSTVHVTSGYPSTYWGPTKYWGQAGTFTLLFRSLLFI